MNMIFQSIDDLWRFRDMQAGQFAQACIERQQQGRIAQAMGRSGIKKTHANCSLDNYRTDHPAYSAQIHQAQHHNLVAARQWFKAYQHKQAGGFVMLGAPGTGKNHLASALGHSIIQRRGSVVIATVEELMMKIRATYRKDATLTEAKIIRWLSQLDLLVIDEVGVQRGSTNESIMLNELINQRSMEQKPTGILSNLNGEQLSNVLGARALDRILEGHSMWLTFDWPSFRQIKGRAA